MVKVAAEDWRKKRVAAIVAVFVAALVVSWPGQYITADQPGLEAGMVVYLPYTNDDRLRPTPIPTPVRFDPNALGFVRDIALSNDGTTLWVADSILGLRGFDVTDPHRPTEVSRMAMASIAPTDMGEPMTQVRVHRGHAFVGFRKSIEAVEIENHELLQRSLTPTSFTYNLLDMEVDPYHEWLFLPRGSYQPDVPGIPFLSINDPTTIFEVGDLAESIDTERGARQTVLVSEDMIFATFDNRHIWIFEVSEPSLPRPIGKLSLLPNGIWRMARHKDLVLATSPFGGLTIVDIALPKLPRIVATFGPQEIPADGVVANNSSISALYGGTLVYRLNLSTPSAPTISDPLDIGSLEQGIIWRMVLHDGIAYAAHDGGIAIIDLRGTNTPELVAQISNMVP